MARAEAGRPRRGADVAGRAEPGRGRRGDQTGRAGATPIRPPQRTGAADRASTGVAPRGARPAVAPQPGARGPRAVHATYHPPRRWSVPWRNGRLAALLSALVLIATLAYLLNSPAFSVRRVDVEGARATGVEQVVAAGGVSGHNIFTVDPQQVADRLAALPTVRQAEAWAELPDRLVVRLIERQPLLIWQANGVRAVIDPEGYVIAAEPTEEQARELVTVAVAGGTVPTIGGQVEPHDVRTVVAALHRLSQQPGITFSAAEYSPRTGLVLRGDGWRLILGDDARLEEKLAVATVLLKGERRWQTLDVTDPDRPVYR